MLAFGESQAARTFLNTNVRHRIYETGM
jgi:hypothetical protein